MRRLRNTLCQRKPFYSDNAEIDILKISHLSQEVAVEEARDLHTKWPKLPKEEKRRIVEAIVERITVGNGEVSIALYYTPPPPHTGGGGGSSPNLVGRNPPYTASENRDILATKPQGFIALLQFVPILLKSLKQKETGFEPRTLGEHVRRRRLVLKLTQKEVADQLKVVPWTILIWEKGHTKPPIASMPALIGFLGYDPFPEPKTLSQHLLAKRRAMGWSIEQAARAIGVDPASWSHWERGQTILLRQHQTQVARLLGISANALNLEMTTCRNRSHERGIQVTIQGSLTAVVAD